MHTALDHAGVSNFVIVESPLASSGSIHQEQERVAPAAQSSRSRRAAPRTSQYLTTGGVDAQSVVDSALW